MAQRNGYEPAAKRVCAESPSAASAAEGECEPMALSDFCSLGQSQHTLATILRRMYDSSEDEEERLSHTEVTALTTREAFETQHPRDDGEWDADPVVVALWMLFDMDPEAYANAWEWIQGLGAHAGELDVKKLLMCMLQFVGRERLEDLVSSILENYMGSNRAIAHQNEGRNPLLIYERVEDSLKYREVTDFEDVGPFFFALWAVIFGAFPDSTRLPVVVEAGRHLAAINAKDLLRGLTAVDKPADADFLLALVDQHFAELCEARKLLDASEAATKELLHGLYDAVDEAEWAQRSAVQLFAEALGGDDTNDPSAMASSAYSATVFDDLDKKHSLPIEMLVKE